MNSVSITEIIRKLRRRETKEEKILWYLLRDRKVEGKKFRRQYPIIYASRQFKKYFFVADFYCPEARLVIELDGKIHDFQKGYDEQRELVIKELGIRVLRIKNEELEKRGDVINKIKEAVK